MSEFEAANRLYQQGSYKEALDAYRQLAGHGVASPALYSNLGNASFRAGRPGEALGWYLRAETLAPRDPALQANLQYVRQTLNSTPPATGWRRKLRYLSLDEWAIGTAAAAWALFLLLAAREAQPAWRRSLRGLTLAAGAACGLLGAVTAVAARDPFRTRAAVVIRPEVTVQRGPFEEALAFYTLREGAEVTLLGQRDGWLQVQDNARRIGWLAGDGLLVIQPWVRLPGI
jgi:tetratricopeptide (TPR) repeat protein